MKRYKLCARLLLFRREIAYFADDLLCAPRPTKVGIDVREICARDSKCVF